jgi:hypothetical protein
MAKWLSRGNTTTNHLFQFQNQSDDGGDHQKGEKEEKEEKKQNERGEEGKVFVDVVCCVHCLRLLYDGSEKKKKKCPPSHSLQGCQVDLI